MNKNSDNSVDAKKKVTSTEEKPQKNAPKKDAQKKETLTQKPKNKANSPKSQAKKANNKNKANKKSAPKAQKKVSEKPLKEEKTTAKKLAAATSVKEAEKAETKDAVVETPKAEETKKETSKVETSNIEASKVESPEKETPKKKLGDTFKKLTTFKKDKTEKDPKPEKVIAETVMAPKKEKESLEPMSYSKELKKRLFGENPVFIKFLAAIPILGAATTLKNGILISAVFVLTVVFLNMIMYPLERFIPKRLRYPVEIIVAAILLTPQLMLAMHFLPTITGLCEFYLPLTALCAVPFTNTQYVGKKHGFGRTVLISILDAAGFTFAALVFSMLREIIGAGLLYERPMPYGSEAKFPFVVYPAGAFILLGFLCALFRKIFGVKDKNKGE